MRLISVRPDDVSALVFRGRPIQFANEEIVLPPRTILVPAGIPITVKDVDGEQIIERYGISGVVAFKEGESDEDARWRAKKTRYTFLVRYLTNFRIQVSAQVASGAPVPLPSEQTHELNKEYGLLSKEILENDPVLKASLPTVEPRPVADVMAAELASFGIGRRVASLAQVGVAATDVPGI